ncbi:hypothetical protein QM012_008398 [Aureobasidium pullulans]|uniref:CID domain-containing protein n=1 Tax=Aureobasidium pullulans TaxID=5580 RepID=A0ABR0TKX6_AURPU
MDSRSAQSSKPDVALLLAKGKLVGCLTTGQSKRSTLDSSDVNNFHNLLQLALNDTTRCTKEFKKCVAWIVCHVAKSRRRVAAFGDYLLKLSDSLLPLGLQSDLDQSTISRAQIALGLLHLIDAIFFRIRENPGRLLRKPLETYLTFAKAIESTVFQLVSSAATSRGTQALSFHQDLACLLHYWSQERLFTKRVRLELRNVARLAYTGWLDSIARTHSSHYGKLITRTCFENAEDNIPNTHGRPGDAWFDLPVGTMVHAMKTTKPGHPVRTGQIKPLDMPTASVDPEMMETVLDHIEECKDIDAIPNISTTANDDGFVLNGLGLRLSRNPLSNEDRPKYKVIEGYYGFSVPFIKIFQSIEKSPSTGPERPQNWMPPPPPELAQPPAFHTGFPPNVPPPNRDGPHIVGSSYRQNDHGRGNHTGWRGEEMQGGRGGGSWRGRGRGWDRGSGGGHRPY